MFTFVLVSVALFVGLGTGFYFGAGWGARRALAGLASARMMAQGLIDRVVQ